MQNLKHLQVQMQNPGNRKENNNKLVYKLLKPSL